MKNCDMIDINVVCHILSLWVIIKIIHPASDGEGDVLLPALSIFTFMHLLTGDSLIDMIGDRLITNSHSQSHYI